MTAPFRVEPLAASHDRRTFHSGEPTLDRYLEAFRRLTGREPEM